MTVLQMSHKNVFFEEEASDVERSIRLVNIMNAIGFSKCEREIHIHDVYLNNELWKVFRLTDKVTGKLTGSTSEGMGGGIYGNQSHHDYDCLCIVRDIKLYTLRTNNINNPPLLPLHDSEDYAACCFVVEDENFPGYVKLSLAEMKTNSVYLNHFTRINDGKQYLPNSMMMNFLYKQVKQTTDSVISSELEDSRDIFQGIYTNGPALTIYNKEQGLTKQEDTVCGIHYDVWPNSANSFITRRKPNNWPSNSVVENIQSQKCDVVPVGHHDSQNNDIQWRISFPGERSLLLDLTDVQILCYALIKIILREQLNTSQREVVSSFHIKHVIFWCVELCSCQWAYSNYINCVNMCLAQLIEMIKGRRIPHYIIKSRNLFNSKLTEKMSKEIVDVLSKYDTIHVFTLDAFERVFKLTNYNNALLKHVTLKSTIMACFKAYINTFSGYVCCTSTFWDLYKSHNATNSLLMYEKIQQYLKKMKGMSIQFAKYLVRSIIGLLYYAKYKESNKAKYLLKSKRQIHKSLNLDNASVKFRAATFFLINREFSQSIEICEKYLAFPPTHIENGEYLNHIDVNVFEQFLEEKTIEEIENSTKTILSMFYSSVNLKSLPGNYDITQQNPVWIYRNFTNIYFHGLYMDVVFMTAEKWVVPDPIQYELLSLPKDANYEKFIFSGIHLEPVFVSFQTKFLCYHSMGNVNGVADMLTVMSCFTENAFAAQSSCVYLNMFAYCQIKAGHHRQSVKSILQSLRIFPSRYNTASGYLKIILQILNSLSI